VLVQRRAAPVVNHTRRSADLIVGKALDILVEKIDQAALAVENAEQNASAGLVVHSAADITTRLDGARDLPISTGSRRRLHRRAQREG